MAYLYRLSNACQKSVPNDIPVVQWLENAAINGSRMALQDLAKVDHDRAQETWNKIRHYFGGVGAIWYYTGQWLHDLSPSKLREDGFNISDLAPRDKIHSLSINIRGDGILHAAAANAACDLVQRLLRDFDIDVDQRNAQGETALLCATRSGHLHAVKILLEHGASASIQAHNGETPLHWLVSFFGPLVKDVGTLLLETGGAVVDACTNQSISHSVFPSNIDVDFQLPGTPLLWAVRNNRPDVVSFLLARGADPQLRSTTAPLQSPLGWAAGMHHTTCLKLIISHLEAQLEHIEDPQPDYLLYGPLIRIALHTADRFSMIIRNGSTYFSQLEATLRLLQDKTKGRFFNITEEHEMPIGYAVSEAHDEAAEILLKLGWGIEDINKPDNANGRTPLLDAVRWNRRHMVKLLLSYGADAHTMARNPFDHDKRNWSALHIFAEQAHNNDLVLVSDLLGGEIPVDGRYDTDVETPFFVAVRRNATRLADFLLSKGADLNALSTRSSLLVSSYPLTGLGHIVALNARHCIPSLRYLLEPHTAVTSDSVDFIVEPTRYLSALHFCAIVPNSLQYTSGDALSAKDFDYETNRRITHELLDWFPDSKHLEERCSIQGRTALHLAAEYGNTGVVEELVKAGADITVKDDAGRSAADIAKSTHAGDNMLLHRILEWLG